MKTKLDNLIDEIQRGKPGQDTVAAEMRFPFQDEFEQPENGWMVEREAGKEERKATLWPVDFLKMLNRGGDMCLCELIPIPEGLTIEPAAHNPEPNDDGKACQSSMLPVPISGDDNYQANNIKIDPEVVYNAMSKSMLDVQDVHNCSEENLPPLSDIAENGRFDVKYGDREENMTNIIQKKENP